MLKDNYMYQLSCLISHIRCARKVRKTYTDLIKTFILLLCTSIRQYKEIETAIISGTSTCYDQLNYNLLFLATVLTNKLVILTILFLQCMYVCMYVCIYIMHIMLPSTSSLVAESCSNSVTMHILTIFAVTKVYFQCIVLQTCYKQGSYFLYSHHCFHTIIRQSVIMHILTIMHFLLICSGIQAGHILSSKKRPPFQPCYAFLCHLLEYFRFRLNRICLLIVVLCSIVYSHNYNNNIPAQCAYLYLCLRDLSIQY